MKQVFMALALVASTCAMTAIAQNSQYLNEGKSFGESIQPKAKGQIVNPSAVDPKAWQGNTGATSVPQGLGGFSQPISGNASLSQAKSIGLTGLGNSALDRCENYTPTGDAAKDQECAAVNFLSVRCMAPTEKQSQVMGKLGTVTVPSSACQGSFGEGQKHFDFSNQVTAKDSIFDVISKSTKDPAAATGQTCTTQTVETSPATNETDKCTKGTSAIEEACSQTANVVITTTQAAAITTNTCPDGTLVGTFCQKSTSGNATPVYTCPAGQTLSGTNCIDKQNVSTPATVVSYGCPAGQTLQGSQCVSTTTTTTAASQTITCPTGTVQSGNSCIATTQTNATPSYYCKAGQTLSGTTCITTTYSSATISYGCMPGTFLVAGGYCSDSCCFSSRCYRTASSIYSCPAGQTLSGTSCIATTTTTASIGYSCPTGSTLSGSTCTTTTQTSATISYSCPTGQTVIGSNCTQTTTTTSSATPNYSCPTGQTLSGSNCIAVNNVITAASVSYTCPAGATLSGTNCITTITTPATIKYSCLDGSAPVNGACIYKSAKTEWVNTCSELERAAGLTLGSPQ